MPELFEVEKILARREIESTHEKNTKEYEYSIKWKGYAAPTWEPVNSLRYCMHLLDTFEKSSEISTKNSRPRSNRKSSANSGEKLSILSREESSNKSRKTSSKKSSKKSRKSSGKTARKSYEEVPLPKKQKKNNEKKKEIFLFQCAKCPNTSFKNHKLLGTHIKEKHPQRIINGISQRRAKCGNCGASYIYAHMLSKHPCTLGAMYPYESSTNFSWRSNTPPKSSPVINSNISMTSDKMTLYQDIFKCLGVDTGMLMRNYQSSETINLI